MRIDIISLFPAMFKGIFNESILKRAAEKNILDIHIVNPRDFAFSKHKNVDDIPFGGGSGMVMKPEPLFRAVDFIKENTAPSDKMRRIIMLSPKGKVFDQTKARELARYDQLIFLCGHYEGFDARIEQELPDELISIGDYVLTGGELPAMVVIDAVARMLPGVLGSEESACTDSFYNGLLEYPQYTRPREFRGLTVPEVLFSGDHAKIREWRRQQALGETKKWRPDLLEKAGLSAAEVRYLSDIENKNSH